MAKSPYPPIPLFNQSALFTLNSTQHLYVPFESVTLSIVDIVIMTLFILAHIVAIILAIVFLGVGYFMKKQKEIVEVKKSIQQQQTQISPSRHSVRHQNTSSATAKIQEAEQITTSGNADLIEMNSMDSLNVTDIGLSPHQLEVIKNRTNSSASDAHNSTTSLSTTPGSLLLVVDHNVNEDNKKDTSFSLNSKPRQSTRFTVSQTSNHLVEKRSDTDGMSKNQKILFVLLLFLLCFQMTSLILLIVHHALNLSGHVQIDSYILKRNSDIASGLIDETSPIELVPSREFRIADRFVGMFQAIVGASCYLIILYILCFIETVFIQTVQKTGTMTKRTAKIITTISVIVTIITTSLIFVSIVSSCVMILLVKSGVITDDELSASLPGAALFIFQVVFHNIIFNVVGFKVLRTIRQYSSKINRESSGRPFFRVIVLQIGLTVFTIIHLIGSVCLALYPSWEFFDAIAFALSSIAILGYTTIIFFLYRPLFNDARIQAKEMKKLLLETPNK